MKMQKLLGGKSSKAVVASSSRGQFEGKKKKKVIDFAKKIIKLLMPSVKQAALAILLACSLFVDLQLMRTPSFSFYKSIPYVS